MWYLRVFAIIALISALGCSRHDFVVYEKTTDREVVRGVGRGEWRESVFAADAQKGIVYSVQYCGNGASVMRGYDLLNDKVNIYTLPVDTRWDRCHMTVASDRLYLICERPGGKSAARKEDLGSAVKQKTREQMYIGEFREGRIELSEAGYMIPDGYRCLEIWADKAESPILLLGSEDSGIRFVKCDNKNGLCVGEYVASGPMPIAMWIYNAAKMSPGRDMICFRLPQSFVVINADLSQVAELGVSSIAPGAKNGNDVIFEWTGEGELTFAARKDGDLCVCATPSLEVKARGNVLEGMEKEGCRCQISNVLAGNVLSVMYQNDKHNVVRRSLVKIYEDGSKVAIEDSKRFAEWNYAKSISADWYCLEY